MASQDSLALLESNATKRGIEGIVDRTLDVSFSGLKNSSTYLMLFAELKRKHAITDPALTLLRLCIMMRASLPRVSRMLGEIAQRTKSDLDRKAAREAGLWCAAYVCEHSNTDSTKIPIHAVTQSHAQNNLELLAACTASLSGPQFLMVIMGQRWVSQLKLGTEGLRSTHKALTKLFWERTVLKSNRSKETYAQGSAFEQGFSEEFYATSCLDESHVVISGQVFTSTSFGLATWTGYNMPMLLKIREEYLMRLESPLKMFEREFSKIALENFQKIVDHGTVEFFRELDNLYPPLLLGQCCLSLRNKSLNNSEVAALQKVGLMDYDSTRSYLEDGVEIGILKNFDYSVMEKVSVPPSATPARLKAAKRALKTGGSDSDSSDSETREKDPKKQRLSKSSVKGTGKGDAPAESSSSKVEEQLVAGEEIVMSIEDAKAMKVKINDELERLIASGIEVDVYSKLESTTKAAMLAILRASPEYSKETLKSSEEDYKSILETTLASMSAKKVSEIISKV